MAKKKSLVDRLEQQAQKPTPTLAFVAIEKEVREALSRGFKIRVIYQTVKESGSFPFTYEAFRRLVKKMSAESLPSQIYSEKSPATKAAPVKARKESDADEKPVKAKGAGKATKPARKNDSEKRDIRAISEQSKFINTKNLV